MLGRACVPHFCNSGIAGSVCEFLKFPPKVGVKFQIHHFRVRPASKFTDFVVMKNQPVFSFVYLGDSSGIILCWTLRPCKMPVNLSTGSYNFVRYQFSKKNQPVLHAGEGFQTLLLYQQMCSSLGVLFFRKYEEFIDRNVQGPIG